MAARADHGVINWRLGSWCADIREITGGVDCDGTGPGTVQPGECRVSDARSTPGPPDVFHDGARAVRHRDTAAQIPLVAPGARLGCAPRAGGTRVTEEDTPAVRWIHPRAHGNSRAPPPDGIFKKLARRGMKKRYRPLGIRIPAIAVHRAAVETYIGLHLTTLRQNLSCRLEPSVRGTEHSVRRCWRERPVPVRRSAPI